jgi:tetratricopeptide (TPR) repeat protein
LKLAAIDEAGRMASIEHHIEARLLEDGEVETSDLVLSGPTLESSAAPLIGDLTTDDALQAYVEINTKDGEPLEKVEATLEVAEAADAPALVSTKMSLRTTANERRVAEGRVALGRLSSGDYVARVVLSQSGSELATISRRFRFLPGPEIVFSPAREYMETIDRYRSGAHRTTRRTLSGMNPEILAEAVDTFLGLEPTTKQIKAAVLAHTEVLLHADSWEEIHLDLARTALSRIEPESHRREYERRWFLMIGDHFHALNRDSEASFIFDLALRSFPEDTEILLAAGAVYEARAWMWGHLDSVKTAKTHYRHVLELDSQNATAHLRLGHLLKLEKDWDKATNELQWTLEHSMVSEERLVANLLLGDIHRARKKLRTAVDYYRAVLDSEPGCRAAATSLSYTLHLAGEYADSRAVLEAFFENGASSRYDTWWYYLRGDSNAVRSKMTRLRKELQ